jgi:hypothetical protein
MGARRAVVVFATATALVAWSCADLGMASTVAESSPLSHARTTPEALAEAALRAIAIQDADSLGALLITRSEYETLIWPSLPDAGQVPFTFVWGISEPRNRKGKREVLEDFRGIPVELVRVELGDDTEAYEGFTFHRGVRLVVRRTDTGEEGRMRFMDVLVEMERGWKFMNFREG